MLLREAGLGAPRVALINGMSQATSSLYHLEHTVVEGLEFHED